MATRRGGLDKATVFGLGLGVGGIVLGNALEGGHFGSLIQFTAGVIVFGGTLGATLVSNSIEDVQRSIDLMKKCFFNTDTDEMGRVSAQIVEASKIAKQESVIKIEEQFSRFSNPFMKPVFRLIVDGVDAKDIEEVFLNEIDIDEQRLKGGARVWSDAAGYAPTIGIIGAVLGLIHVMANLTNTAELGKGIAVAFVATIYGVASANLFFLPMANKIKRNIEQQRNLKEMILAGALAIAKGKNTSIVNESMKPFLRS